MAIWTNYRGYHNFFARGISGLLIPLFTGRLVDKFSTSSINWNIVLLFAGIFIANALLSGIGIYLLSKIGEKMIYDIRSILWGHIIKLKMPFLIRMKADS